MYKKQSTILRIGLILAVLAAGLSFPRAASASLTPVCPTVVGVTASGSYPGTSPLGAFDCNDSTSWNAGWFSGTITAEFSTQLIFDGIEITANALPNSYVDYEFYGSNDGVNFTLITAVTRYITVGVNTYPVISISPTASYRYLRVNASSATTWIALNKLRLQLQEPPVANAGGPYLVQVGGTITLDGSGSSDSDGDSLSYQWAATGGTMSGSDYTAGSEAGVFEASLTVTDPGGLSDTATAMVVVYDPSGGFVTGGGWIWSAAGTCLDASVCDTAAEGKANFGFVSKYKKGASVPTGNTEFQFQAGGLNFHSESYEWLVVNQNDSNAQFKGSGTINGALDSNGNAYTFMLWAGDGSPDTFRIKIWLEDASGEHVVYDNGDLAISGGNIVVHKGK